MATIKLDIKGILWTGVEAYCPICKKTFTGWYCPTCGLPKKNSKYAIYKDGDIFNCDSYHFRPEFSSFEHFQLCDKCYTTNPSDAKYCRNCKNKLVKSKGVTKENHGWVDLGLSVLWSTETMESRFRWMSCNEIHNYSDPPKDYRGEGKDAATERWGAKWRTPTREEFEELILQCKWNRCIDPKSKKYALKATGPNGNSIMLTLSENDNILLWTSTEYTKEFEGKKAYGFQFSNDIEIEKTLTAKQKKAIEFQKSNATRFKLDLQCDLTSASLYLSGQESRAREYEEREKRRKYPEYEKTMEQQRQILDAMGDDRQERENNAKKDKEKRDNLWIKAPVEFKFNEQVLIRNTLAVTAKKYTKTILPVADKKWKGEL